MVFLRAVARVKPTGHPEEKPYFMSMDGKNIILINLTMTDFTRHPALSRTDYTPSRSEQDRL